MGAILRFGLPACAAKAADGDFARSSRPTALRRKRRERSAEDGRDGARMASFYSELAGGPAEPLAEFEIILRETRSLEIMLRERLTSAL